MGADKNIICVTDVLRINDDSYYVVYSKDGVIKCKNVNGGASLDITILKKTGQLGYSNSSSKNPFDDYAKKMIIDFNKWRENRADMALAKNEKLFLPNKFEELYNLFLQSQQDK